MQICQLELEEKNSYNNFPIWAVSVLLLQMGTPYIDVWLKDQSIPWIYYERSFSEFYLSIWNQLVFNQRLQLFVQSPQPYLLIFAWRN